MTSEASSPCSSTHPENRPAVPFVLTDDLTASLGESTIARYFESLNAADYATTANLFAAEGVLYPPFEDGIVGREAIAAYLSAEATGMQLLPREATRLAVETEAGECAEYRVLGKVQTSLFSVNVGWQFVLNSDAEILSVKVKLLAALEELLHLRP